MSPEALLELWEEIASADAGESGLDRRLLEVEAPVSLYACIFWPSGRPGLLVEGAGEERPAEGRIPKCRGVRLIHEVTASVPRRTVLRILLEDARLQDIFAVLSADLVNAVTAERTAAEALRRCIDRLSMWQGLFERLPAEGLSEEAQRGLFGELAVLEEVLDALSPLEGVTAWTGPDPKNQDFIHEGIALEVKTSLAKRHAHLTIANERQLDERPHRLLLLVYLRLEESVAHGMTLPARIERCRALFRDDAAAGRAFDDQLVAGGYLDVHAPLYSSGSWRVSAMRFFEVRDDFPRLTDANLPAGVGDIRYSIVADDLVTWEVSREDAIRTFGGG